MERSFAYKAYFLFLFLLALGAFSLCKLYTVQASNDRAHPSKYQKMWSRSAPLQARHGRILANDGKTVLATDIKLARIVIERRMVKDAQVTGEKLAAYAGLSPETITARINDPKEPASIEVAHDVAISDAETISALKLPGVFTRYYYQRKYPYGANFAPHTVGYTCQKTELSIGLESKFQKTLTGVDSEAKYDTDGLGRIIPQTYKGGKPVDGKDVITTLDPAIQQICETVLRDRIGKNKANWGLIAVMDPNTGEILASAAQPAFDPNEYARKGSKGNEANPLVHFAYEPGSVIKPLIATAALDRGWINTEQRFSCYPTLKIGKYTIYEAEHDKNPAGYGEIPIENVIIHSSNVGMAQVGKKLGQHKLADIFSTYGLYERTGVELPSEAKGIRPCAYDNLGPNGKWPEIVTACAAFGQGIAITPLQLMRAYSAIANGGWLVKPKIVKNAEADKKEAKVGGDAVPLAEGETLVSENEAAPTHSVDRDAVRILSENETARMRGILQKVVRIGTGKLAALDNYNAAGKTGTAQVPGRGGYAKGKYNATFIGFFPANEPRYVIIVVFAEPKGSYYASAVSAPAFHDVAERIAVAKEVPPEKKDETN
jgi:cell division protein FtsI/penicillin-binding protein 2